MLPDAAAPRDTRMIGIGGFCGPCAPPPDPRDADRLTFLSGPKHQFGYMKIGASRPQGEREHVLKMTASSWAWWCHVHAESEAEHKAWLAASDDELRARMFERYGGWAAPTEDFIRATESFLRTPIHDIPALPTWHRGRVLLVGDAAHAMSPAGGQGASLALEDAMVFAGLAGDRSRPIEEAMAHFESMRRPRAEKIVAQGYENDRRSLKELGPFSMWMRDRVMMPLFTSFIERELTKVYTATARV
jgi:2-polyprenyl-6-methoxyphenol hydroxylase-like FAD-dependent oxidoreductase